MHWVLVLIGLTVAIATTMWLSYAFTCSFDLATAAFTGLAVVAAILAYRAQDKQHAQVVLDAKRSQLWASFDSMMALAESRRPDQAFIDGARMALRQIDHNDPNAYREATNLLLRAYPGVADYWMVVGVWCNLLFSTHSKGLKDDVKAISTLLVGAIGTSHVDCLIEYAATSYQSAFYPLIVAIWEEGGMRDKVLSDLTPRIEKTDQNIRKYRSIRLTHSQVDKGT